MSAPEPPRPAPNRRRTWRQAGLWAAFAGCTAAVWAAGQCSLPLQAAAETTISGDMVALDGDTLWHAGGKIRLHGIDAFETDQPCHLKGSGTPYACGIEARAQLERLLQRHGRQVMCTPEAIDRYGRSVATCHAGRTDLALAMVKAGWALAWERYLDGEKLERYRAAQDAAEAAGRGAWAGRFERPWVWRSR